MSLEGSHPDLEAHERSACSVPCLRAEHTWAGQLSLRQSSPRRQTLVASCDWSHFVPMSPSFVTCDYDSAGTWVHTSSSNSYGRWETLCPGLKGRNPDLSPLPPAPAWLSRHT